MPIMFGDEPIQAIRLGTDEITAIYLGSDLVWSRTAIYLDFEDAPATSDLTPLGFVHYGSSTYKMCVSGGVCRVNMPDGVSQLGEFIDRARFDDHVAPGDDGYIQFRVVTTGFPPNGVGDQFITEVFGRGSNGNVTHGAGVRLVNSQLQFVKRIASVDTTLNAGSFAAGDTIRLDFNGPLYTLRRNGALQLEWEDTGGTVSVGSGFRSLLLRMTGGRRLFDSRRFSPAIDYVEYG